jgi:hypothetical protein
MSSVEPASETAPAMAWPRANVICNSRQIRERDSESEDVEAEGVSLEQPGTLMDQVPICRTEEPKVGVAPRRPSLTEPEST